jgi:tRNA-2-methylthio-N6-dimethylallyladenosine synthase
MVRQSAEDRVVGLVRNLGKLKEKGKGPKIIITGCMAGMALGDTSGKFLKQLQKRMPYVDAFLPIEEIGLPFPQLRKDSKHALVPISNGCNNFCSFCVVPYGRGREESRPFEEIIKECKELAKKGYTSITLLGQNVNSYGADLLKIPNPQPALAFGKSRWRAGKFQIPNKFQLLKIKQLNNKKITYVKHLGRLRIPTLFPYLLDEVCKIKGIKNIDFLSSNPWDFSDDLTTVIAKNPKISRRIHLPIQSGDDEILKKMNRWYTVKEYEELIDKMRKKIPGVTFSTDIIVGFPGETGEQFAHTVDLCKKVGFVKAYIAMYSDRPMTEAHKKFPDTLPYQEKKRRWGILEKLINKPIRPI